MNCRPSILLGYIKCSKILIKEIFNMKVEKNFTKKLEEQEQKQKSLPSMRY